MADNIPNEVMMKILVGLPVRTLLQIRCVCKSWCSLISSDNFVTFWFNRRTHLNSTHHLLLIKHYSEHEDQEHFSLYLDDESLTEYHLNLENHPIANLSSYLTILGSCNGLVCLMDDMLKFTDILYLWNPTVRKFIVLPEPSITFSSHGPYERALGFGFDSTTNDFKVVRIVYGSGGNEVDIYSLREGCWRSISVSGAIPDIHCESSHAYLNGAIHWVSRGGNYRLQIVSFNLGTKIFSEMELPTSLGYIRLPRMLSVSVFHESLCVFHNDSWERKVSIWVMKQYGVVDSWTNLFNLDFLRGSGKVIGLMRNGEVLLAHNEEMISTDSETQYLKYLGIYGKGEAFSVNTYTESLVLIDKPMRALHQNTSLGC
ncbi:F-box/kelch-repeat protein At3g06240-like [Cornus florida]|uniref:F-box/kelch-repeat protein At3g06240-like n=1 Tax=Cornus florida TaxID=4283 RepID=UPI0028A017A2|nr:F-box/kelch-repeat protein At3g06240-like [Cornus florida]